MDQKRIEVTGNNPIVHLHLPKTGGSTLESLFFRNYPREEIFMAYAPHDGEIARFGALPADTKQRYKVVSGHFRISDRAHLGDTRNWVTFLRNPLERQVSQYYNIVCMDNHRYSKLLRDNNIALKHFPLLDIDLAKDNLQTRWIAGIPDHEPCTPKTLKTAMANIRNYFSFVGILDMFPQSVFFMGSKFSWTDLSFGKGGCNPKRKSLEELDKETLRALIRSNLYDMELYEHFRKQLQARVDALDEFNRSRLEPFIALKRPESHIKTRYDFRDDEGNLIKKTAGS